jgi:ATP-binding cassette subfamily B protein
MSSRSTTVRSDHAVPGEHARGLFWLWSGIRDALENLITKSGLPLTAYNLPGEPDLNFLRSLQWIRRAPRGVGLDTVEETEVPMGLLLSRFMEINGPVLIALEHQRGETVALTAILDRGPWGRVLKPDGTEVRMRRDVIHAAIVQLMSKDGEALAPLFEGLPGGATVFRTMQRTDALGEGRHVLLVRFLLDGAHPIAAQIRATGGWRSLTLHAALSGLQAFAALAAFWTLGNTMIDGQVDVGRIAAWTLLSLSDAPLQYLASIALADFSISMWLSIKRRLLEGAFFANEKDVRAKGFGELIARTNEASVIEQLSLAEASGVFLAVFEVIGAAFFLARGAPWIPSMLALGATVVMTGFLVRANARAYRAVFECRMGLTDDLVDKIIGHRTRAVQQSPQYRHGTEDIKLSEYAESARRLDRLRTLSSVMPRVWLTVGAGILLLAFVTRAPLVALINSALGILFCFRALSAFFPAVERLVEWYCAWRGIEALLTAGQQRDRVSRPLEIDVHDEKFATTLSMSTVSFSYRAGGRPVLLDAEMRVRAGEKVLLEGASGSGKTTLFKIIAGEQIPSSGIVLVGGTDRFSVSDIDWRRRVASAPQFHENYIFSHTFAFNLDPWGEPGVETEEQREICSELGLRPLLERMPQGFAQVIGETGWQLSHGERSRLFIARALLQKADLFLFDENFGALDPETLMQALDCVRRRAKTLVVIAHT